jgi:hypothetical protein
MVTSTALSALGFGWEGRVSRDCAACSAPMLKLLLLLLLLLRYQLLLPPPPQLALRLRSTSCLWLDSHPTYARRLCATSSAGQYCVASKGLDAARMHC